MDVLDGVRDGVKMFIISQGSITESFIKIQHQELHLSFKSLPGVLEDMDILDGVGDGVKMFIISQGSITESFIKI